MKSKYLIISIILCFITWKVNAQDISTGQTSFKFNNTPKLSIENIKFTDENGTQKADADEKCFLVFTLKNTGKSMAKAVKIFTNTKDSIHAYFSFEKAVLIGNIQIGESKEVKIPIVAATSFEDANENFEVIAREANNYNSKPVFCNAPVKATAVTLAINWNYPYTTETKVNTATYTLKACILSSLPVTQLTLVQNGKPYSIDRGFKVVEAQNCDYYMEREITLEPGSNQIQIIAKNKIKSVESDIRLLVFSELEVEKRVALIIGNADYKSAPLRNPVNDATLMSTELKKLGFEVNTIKNGTQNQIRQAISEFGELLAKDKNTVGLFYYAGHGVQIKGKNYLVPTDAKIEKEPDVEVYCVDLDGLLSNLEYSGNNMNIIILDACRNNPFARSFRSMAGDGLASVNAPSGTFIAYATAPGSVAADGSGNNGLYTQEFVKAVSVPNIRIEDVFKRVRTQVKTLSEGKQTPWESASIEGDFYFVK